MQVRDAGRRPVVLVLMDYYLPGYRAGGPIPAVRNLTDALGDALLFRIATRDRDLGDSAPFADVDTSGWHSVGRAEVCYLPAAPVRRATTLLSLARSPYDLLFLNSLFSVPLTTLALVLRRLGLIPRRPVLLAPRGECAPGALALNPRRKRWFLAIGRRLGLYADVTWQASGPHEAHDIQRVFGERARIVTAPDLPSPLQDNGARSSPKRVGAARLAFVGRISRMKNLEGVVQALRRVRGNVICNVFGPIEDPTYWSEIQAMAAALPATARLVHHGPIDPAGVARMFVDHDALLLPTRGENFGYVILESLSAGCPVIISDRTRWQDLESARAGWVCSLDDHAAFARCIDAVCAQDAAAHAEWSTGARAMAERYVADASAVDAAREALHVAMGCGRP
jgi:glycosyltransferase involved in cell wall biosynthesis